MPRARASRRNTRLVYGALASAALAMASATDNDELPPELRMLPDDLLAKVLRAPPEGPGAATLADAAQESPTALDAVLAALEAAHPQAPSPTAQPKRRQKDITAVQADLGRPRNIRFDLHDRRRRGSPGTSAADGWWHGLFRDPLRGAAARAERPAAHIAPHHRDLAVVSVPPATGDAARVLRGIVSRKAAEQGLPLQRAAVVRPSRYWDSNPWDVTALGAAAVECASRKRPTSGDTAKCYAAIAYTVTLRDPLERAADLFYALEPNRRFGSEAAGAYSAAHLGALEAFTSGRVTLLQRREFRHMGSGYSAQYENFAARTADKAARTLRAYKMLVSVPGRATEHRLMLAARVGWDVRSLLFVRTRHARRASPVTAWPSTYVDRLNASAPVKADREFLGLATAMYGEQADAYGADRLAYRAGRLDGMLALLWRDCGLGDRGQVGGGADAAGALACVLGGWDDCSAGEREADRCGYGEGWT